MDIPDTPDTGGRSLQAAEAIVFDAVTNYVSLSHSRDTSTWCSKAGVQEDTEEEYNKSANKTAYSIYRYHKFWADACAELEWSYEEVQQEKLQ